MKKDERTKANDEPLTPEEKEMAAMLRGNGWSQKEAEAEARRALKDAAEEDGYDGP